MKPLSLTGALVLAVACYVHADEFRISLDFNNSRARVQAGSNDNCYYVLWRGDSPEQMWLPEDMALGSAQSLLTHKDATNQAQFYRVEKVSSITPRDTDRDGIDDYYELTFRHPGAALNLNDGNEDHDGNGVPDRIDAARLTLTPGGARGRGVVAAGDQTTLALKSDGSVWGSGHNYFNELDRNDVIETNVLVQVGSISNWISVVSRMQYSFGLRRDGSIWAWGGNTGEPKQLRQVGTNFDWAGLSVDGNRHLYAVKRNGTIWSTSPPFTKEPVQIGSEMDWASIAARNPEPYALKRNGTLWRLASTPVQVDTNSDWKTIACSQANYSGHDVALAIKTNGTLWAWGIGTSGELGLGATTNEFGVVYGMPASDPTQVGSDSNWVAISVGMAHVLALKADGSLWGWGGGARGELGPVRTDSVYTPVRLLPGNNWIAISAGYDHSVAMNANGEVWTFGHNQSGELGDGSPALARKPAQIGSETNWASVAGGGQHTMALQRDGSLWGWGYNFYGQVSESTNVALGAPVRVGTDNDWRAVYPGEAFTLAIKSNGTLWAWGQNHRGQLGNGTFFVPTNRPVRVGMDSDWLTASAGFAHSLAVKSNGTLWAWGDSTLGIAITNVPVQVGAETNWLNVTAGEYMSLGTRWLVTTQFLGGGAYVLRTNNDTYAWGRQVGSFSLRSTVPTLLTDSVGVAYHFSSVAAAKAHTTYSFALAIRNGVLFGWGANSGGQLGMNFSSIPIGFPQTVGTNQNWSAVAIGNIHSVGVQSNGTLWAWGWTQLDVPGFSPTSAYGSTYITTQVGTETNWVSVAAGDAHAVALKTDGTLWSWGDNSYGQCGQPATTGPVRISEPGWGFPPSSP